MKQFFAKNLKKRICIMLAAGVMFETCIQPLSVYAENDTEIITETEVETESVIDTEIEEAEDIETITVDSEVIDSEVIGSEVIGSEVIGLEVIGLEVIDSEVIGSEVIGLEVIDSEVIGSEVIGLEVIDSEVIGSEVIDSEIIDSETIDSEVIDSEVTDSEITDSEIIDSEIIDSEVVEPEIDDSETTDKIITETETIEGIVTNGFEYQVNLMSLDDESGVSLFTNNQVIYDKTWLDNNYKCLFMGNSVILLEYIGTDVDLIVPGYIDSNGTTYNVCIGNYGSTQIGPSSYASPLWSNRNDLKSITFGNNVKLPSNSNYLLGGTSFKSVSFEDMDTSHVTNMSSMFNGCESLATLDLSNIDMANVSNATNMLTGCTKMSLLNTPKNVKVDVNIPVTLYGTDGTGYQYLPKESTESVLLERRENTTWQEDYDYDLYPDTGRIVLWSYEGEEKENIFVPSAAVVDGIKYTTVVSGSDSENLVVFKPVKETLKTIKFEEGVKLNSTISYMFSGMPELVECDLSGAICNVRNMNHMFKDCTKLEKVVFPAWDVTDIWMVGVFWGCTSLKEVDMSQLNVVSEVQIQYMFYGCESLESIVLPEMIIENSNATFDGCKSLKTICLDSLKMIQDDYIRQMDYMFRDCESLEEVVWNFDTTNQTTLCNKMFYNCKSLRVIDIPNLIIDECEDILYNCTSLEYLRYNGGWEEVILPKEMCLSGSRKGLKTKIPSGYVGSAIIAKSSTDWQDEYEYELLEDKQQIHLIVYTGDGGDVIVPAQALVDGKVYRTVLYASDIVYKMGNSVYKANGGPWYIDFAFEDIVIQSIEFEEGVLATGDCAALFAGMDNITKLDLSPIEFKNVTVMDHLFLFDTKLQTINLSTLNMSEVNSAQYMFGGVETTGDTVLDLRLLNLQKLEAPVNCKVEVELPHIMYDNVGNSYDSLPTNQSQSLRLSKTNTADPTNWYLDYTYELFTEEEIPELGNTILLISYNGAGGELYVPATATIDGVEYRTTLCSQESENIRLAVGPWTDTSMMNGTQITKLEFADGVRVVENAAGLFAALPYITELDLSGIEFLDVCCIDYMFVACESLEAVDMSSLDMSNVETYDTTMGGMFDWCEKLVYIYAPTNCNVDITLPSDSFYIAELMPNLTSIENIEALPIGREKPVQLQISCTGFAIITTLDGVPEYLPCLTGYTKMPDVGEYNAILNAYTMCEISVGDVIVPKDTTDTEFAFIALNVDETDWYTNYDYEFLDESSSLGALFIDTREDVTLLPMITKVDGKLYVTVSKILFDYEVEYDYDNYIVTLTNYIGSDTELYVPGVAYNAGEVYQVALRSSEETYLSIWDSGADTITSIEFGEGVVLPESIGGMFSGLTALERLDVSKWDTSHVTDMASLFNCCESLIELDLSSFNTSNVEWMEYMFDGCTSLKYLDISSFRFNRLNPGNDYIFFDNVSLETLIAPEANRVCIPIGKVMYDPDGYEWDCLPYEEDRDYPFSITLTSTDPTAIPDTTWQENYRYITYGNRILLLEYLGGDTEIVVPGTARINGKEYITELTEAPNDESSIWAYKPVTSIYFEKGVKLPKSCAYMFSYCQKLTNLNLSNFNTSDVTNMEGMFYYCPKLVSLDLSSFDTSSVTNMSYMFSDCELLATLDVSSFNTNNVTSINGMFLSCCSLVSLDLSSFDMSKVTNANTMLNGCSSLVEIKTPINCTLAVKLPHTMYDNENNVWIELPTNKLESITICTVENTTWQNNYTYTLDTNTKTITLTRYAGSDTEIFVPSKAVISGVVYTTKLYEVPGSQNTSGGVWFPVRETLTSLVFEEGVQLPNNCQWTFNSLGALVNLDISKLDTSNVTVMDYMFSKCMSLESLDLTHFDTNNVVSMVCMFSNCSGLKSLNVSSFNTQGVTNMNAMFLGCNSLTGLDLSSFDMCNVSVLSNMINGCTALEFLKTPCNVAENVALPVILYDENFTEYLLLPMNSSVSKTLKVLEVDDWLKDYTYAIDTESKNSNFAII